MTCKFTQLPIYNDSVPAQKCCTVYFWNQMSKIQICLKSGQMVGLNSDTKSPNICIGLVNLWQKCLKSGSFPNWTVLGCLKFGLVGISDIYCTRNNLCIEMCKLGFSFYIVQWNGMPNTFGFRTDQSRSVVKLFRFQKHLKSERNCSNVPILDIYEHS